MSDGISFVLHAPADDAYAASLAAAIGALPLKLQPNSVASLQFGAGVVCIIVWNEALAPQSEALTRALSSGIALVVHRQGSAPPAAWAHFDAVVARDPVADAAALAEIAQTHRVTAFERMAQLQGATAAKQQPLAARSAYGMAATLAIASFVTPWIMERAQATDATGANLQPPSAPAQGAGMLRASLAAMSAGPAEDVDTIASPTPALDRWLAPTAENAIVVADADVPFARAEPVLVAFTRDAAPLDVPFAAATETAAVASDPKREAFSFDFGDVADGGQFHAPSTAKNS